MMVMPIKVNFKVKLRRSVDVANVCKAFLCNGTFKMAFPFPILYSIFITKIMHISCNRIHVLWHCKRLFPPQHLNGGDAHQS